MLDIESNHNQFSPETIQTIISCFFGTRKNTEVFSFDKKDISTIIRVVNYVKKNENKCQDNKVRYYKELANAQKLISTPIGEFFGNSSNYEIVQGENNNRNILLKKMSSSLQKNLNVQPEGRRYDKDLRDYCAYKRIIGGKLCYETYKANCEQSVPSLSAIDKYISKEKSKSVEGEIRAMELLKYLNDMNQPLFVTLSEDATRIIGRPQYDRTHNQIVGFPLPLDENGLPKKLFYKARFAAEIESAFFDKKTDTQRKTARYVIVVMAQPLSKNVPPFCLLAFPTDCSYKAIDVQLKWKCIANILESVGIKVIAIGSDSDSRYNLVMRDELQLGFNRKTSNHPPNFPEWFSAKWLQNYLPFQDVPHIGTKLRNRYLTNELKIGKYTISSKHLLKLIDLHSKDEHNLTKTTVEAKDRMCFDSLLKICSLDVINLLESSVAGSEGTVFYLRIIRMSLRAFLDLSLNVLERVRFIWFVVFCLRGWRAHITETGGTTLDNFLSSNCYACCEINAHSLVLLIIYLKENNLEHLFHPELLGSQQCESIFRQFRSMTSTYSTKTNFTMLEIIHRLYKTELINQIMHVKLKHFDFPRLGKESKEKAGYFPSNSSGQKTGTTNLPTKSEIINEIEMAKLQALEYLDSLGVISSSDFKCTIKPPVVSPKLEEPPINNEYECKDLIRHLKDIKLKDFSKECEKIDETSEFVRVRTISKPHKTSVVKKPSLCWLMTENVEQVSNDRVRRFRNQ